MRVYELGARVYGNVGELWGWMAQVVLDEETHVASHAVVYSAGDGRSRLVPIEMTRPIPRGIRLSCSARRLAEMESPVAVHGVDSPAVTEPGEQPLEADERLPAGAVAVSQAEPVEAADGAVGRVQALVIAEDCYEVTHLVVEEKHLWSRKRTAVPWHAIAEIDHDVLRLRWTQATVKSQPRFKPDGATDV